VTAGYLVKHIPPEIGQFITGTAVSVYRGARPSACLFITLVKRLDINQPLC